jgi:hypothetical protein
VSRRLSVQTPTKKIWSMVRLISGKSAPLTKSNLKVNGVSVKQSIEVENTIASTVSHDSSSGHYSE